MVANDRPAIPAATLGLSQQTAFEPAHHFMIERTARIMFAAGTLTLPSWRIDLEDHARPADSAHAVGGGNADERVPRLAAVRETIEETSVVVGCTPCPSDAVITEWLRALRAGTPFAHLPRDNGVVIDVDARALFARWCLDLGEHRGFDTRFDIVHEDRAQIVTYADEWAASQPMRLLRRRRAQSRSSFRRCAIWKAVDRMHQRKVDYLLKHMQDWARVWTKRSRAAHWVRQQSSWTSTTYIMGGAASASPPGDERKAT